MSVRLPSRYEDLDPGFRGRLRPNLDLIEIVRQAFVEIDITGGLRFLPIYGKSGSGKSSATLELPTHLPECDLFPLRPEAISRGDTLLRALNNPSKRQRPERALRIAVVDQYEEFVAAREDVPTQFVERLSLLDRTEWRGLPTLILWLTTSRTFQSMLAEATTRNKRMLLSADFEHIGPPLDEWPDIIAETFEFHNGRTLADYNILTADLEDMSWNADTIGQAIEASARRISRGSSRMQDLSKYQLVMIWPVTDAVRLARVTSFTHARDGYKLNWDTWYRSLNHEAKHRLPLHAYNRARYYFDVRLVPVAVADLHPLFRDLHGDHEPVLYRSHLERLNKSHLCLILSGRWQESSYRAQRERSLARGQTATEWYESVTRTPVALGERLALCLKELGIAAKHESIVRSPYGRMRADLLVTRPGLIPDAVIIELKAFSPKLTTPSAIRDAIQVTLRRLACFAGFLEPQ